MGDADHSQGSRDEYTVAEAAKILGRSRSTVRRWFNEGRITGRRDEDAALYLDQSSVHDVKNAIERSGGEAGAASEQVERLALELGMERGRLQITEATETSLRAERDELRSLLNAEMERRVRAESDLEFTRRENEELRERAGRPWWRRLGSLGG